MPDNQLSFTTRVDLSGLNEGAAEAQVVLEKLSATTAGAMEQEAAAFNAVSEAFAEFDTFLQRGIEDNAAYAASINEIASSYEAQTIAQTTAAREAASAAASQAIAEHMLMELSKERTAQQIASANYMNRIYADAAGPLGVARDGGFAANGADQGAVAVSAQAIAERAAAANVAHAASADEVTAAYQRLIGVQSEQAAAQAATSEVSAGALQQSTEAEIGFGASVEEANAFLEAQGVLWLQNAQAAESASAPIVQIAAANAAVGETAVASAEQGVAAYASLEAAEQAVADATMLLGSAQEQFGRQAAVGNEWAIATIKQYQAELAAATEAVATFTAAQAEETASVSSTTAAIAGNTAALEANTAAEYSRTEAMGVARVSAGLATGSVGALDMGLARLAATSSMIGPILQAAMPFALIAAGIFIVVEMGEALYKAFDIGGERARALQQDIAKTSIELDRMTTSIEVQTDKLAQEQAKLENKPFNGMKLTLDEAAESAAKLAGELERVNVDFEKNTIAKMGGSMPQRLLGASGTHDEQVMVEEHQKYLNQAVNIQQQMNEETSYGNALQSHLIELKAKQGAIDEANIASARAGGATTLQNEDNAIAATQAMIARQEKEKAAIQATIDLGAQQVATQTARDNHTGKGAKGKDPDVQALRDIESSFASANAAESAVKGHNLTAGEGAAFWSQYLTTFKEGSEQAKHVLEEFTKYQEEIHKSILKGSKAPKDTDAEQERAAKSTAELTKEFAKQEGALTHTGEAWDKYQKEVSKGGEIQAENAAKLQAANNAIDEADGRITKLAGAERKAKLDAEEWAAKIKALTKDLKDLQAQAQIKIDPITGQSVNTNPQNAQQTQQAQNQLNQALGGQAVSQKQDQNAQAQALAAPYLKAFDQINSGWLKVQNDMIVGNKNIARDFVQMGVSIVQAGAQAAEKWLAKQITTYIMDKAQQHIALLAKQAAAATANAQQVATTTATATAQTAAVTAGMTAQTAAVTTGIAAQTIAVAGGVASQHAIQGPANVATVTGDAAVAAAGAMAYWSAIAPIIAPSMAAAQFGMTMAYAPLAAFDIGGIIPGSGAVPMIGHGGERVLTQGQTNTFESFVNNMSTQTHGGNNMHATVNQHFASPKASSARETRGAIQSLMRRGKLA